jgi:hypothetical protein
MKNKIAALVAASLFTTQALAAVTLDLSGDYVRIGVSDYGTIGSKSNTSPGILYDNSGTGTFNTAYDYLTPGSPFEGFGITLTTGGATTNYHNNNTGIQNITGGVLTDYSGTAYNGTTFDNRAVWTGSTTEFDLAHDYRFNNNQKFVDITTVLTAKADLTNLYFGRFTDPDARAAAGDSSATLNALGYGVIPSNQVVFSEATVSKYALGLYSADTNVGAGISSSWSPLGATYYNGANGGNGDYTIGLGWYLPTLANGATATFNYAYIFGPSAFAAGETAVTSGAGGGTPGVVPGCTSSCTLTDVGDASAPATPTVTGTSTTNIVTSSTSYSAWSSAFASTYAYAISHATPAITNNRLVIGRDNTTTTTVTETQTRTETTTTTTTPRTTTTYSNGTSTVADGTASSSNTTATQTQSLAVATPTTVSQTASAPIDTVDNSMLLNIYSQEMNRADPLNRINLVGDKITRRTSQAKDIDRNTWAWISGKSANGNDSRGTGFEIGVERLINDTTLVGLQYNKINSNLTKVEQGTGKFDTDMASVYAVKKLGRWAVKPSVGYGSSDYRSSRTIVLGAQENFAEEVYSNSYSTKGKSVWADLQVIAPQLWKITPYAGLTLRKTQVNGGTETGTEVTRVTYGKYNDTSSQPYVGARFDSDVTDRGVFYTVDGRVTKFNLADTYKYGDTLLTVNSLVGYKLNDRGQVYAGYQYQHASDYNNGIISIGGKIDF